MNVRSPRTAFKATFALNLASNRRRFRAILFLLMTPRYPLPTATEIHLNRWSENWGPLQTTAHRSSAATFSTCPRWTSKAWPKSSPSSLAQPLKRAKAVSSPAPSSTPQVRFTTSSSKARTTPSASPQRIRSGRATALRHPPHFLSGVYNPTQQRLDEAAAEVLCVPNDNFRQIAAYRKERSLESHRNSRETRATVREGGADSPKS